MRRKTVTIYCFVLLVLLASACGEIEPSLSPSEDLVEPMPQSTPEVSERFEVSAEMDTFTQKIDDMYFSKYGRHLFSDQRWWLDYGTDKDSGGIVSVSVVWSSTERLTEQTAQTFTEFFNCVAMIFMPNISEEQLDQLLEDLCESENRIEHHSEPYPTTVYFTDEIYCYSYFKDGNEVIYFGKDVLEKLPQYASNNVRCIEIEQEGVNGPKAQEIACDIIQGYFLKGNKSQTRARAC